MVVNMKEILHLKQFESCLSYLITNEKNKWAQMPKKFKPPPPIGSGHVNLEVLPRNNSIITISASKQML